MYIFRRTAALVRCILQCTIEGCRDDVHHPIILVNLHHKLYLMYIMFSRQSGDVHRTRMRMRTKPWNVRSERSK